MKKKEQRSYDGGTSGAIIIPVFETAEEAIEEAIKQAAEQSLTPTSVMVSFREGYVTGDGQVHTAGGVTAAARQALEVGIETSLPSEPEQVVIVNNLQIVETAEAVDGQEPEGIISEELLENLQPAEPEESETE